MTNLITLDPQDLPEKLGQFEDISGILQVGPWLMLGDDEGAELLVLRFNESGVLEMHCRLPLAKSGREVDIEALEYADGHVYVCGSHSLRRRSLRPDTASAASNRKRFLEIDRQKERYRLYRIPFDLQSGRFGDIDRISLRKELRRHPLLGPFTALPSKENGVDIEGMAARGGRLYLGMRGPVLRYNLVPVLVLDYEHSKRFQVSFVELQGQGIRDMCPVAEGFILLSGPVSDAPSPFRLWFWDGHDQMPGSDRNVTPASLIGPLEAPENAKAEGITLLREDEKQRELLLAFDGVAGGYLSRVTVPR